MESIAMLGFCLLMLAVMVLLQVALPIFLIYKLAAAVIRYSRTGKLPWQRDELPPQAGEPATLKQALDRARETAVKAETAAAQARRPEPAVVAGEESAAARAARAEEEVRLAESLLKRKRDELASAMKEQGKLDRLALVYYVEASLREGCAADAVAGALKAKGWPEADITAAFQACGAAI